MKIPLDVQIYRTSKYSSKKFLDVNPQNKAKYLVFFHHLGIHFEI